MFFVLICTLTPISPILLSLQQPSGSIFIKQNQHTAVPDFSLSFFAHSWSSANVNGMTDLAI